MSEDDLFGWGNEYVRHTDPQTSHEAAEELDVSDSSFEALGYFHGLYKRSPDGIIAAEFEQDVERQLIAQGWDRDRAYRHAESLRRRLSDLAHKYAKIELRLDEQGKTRKREKQQIYFLSGR